MTMRIVVILTMYFENENLQFLQPFSVVQSIQFCINQHSK